MTIKQSERLSNRTHVISELKELPTAPIEKNVNDDYEDLTDSDDHLDDMDQTCSIFHRNIKLDKSAAQRVTRSQTKRKKVLEKTLGLQNYATSSM